MAVDPAHVTFYRDDLAFPSTAQHRLNSDPCVSVQVDPPEAPNYEFTVSAVGAWSARCYIALRLNVFADAWQAFSDLPDLMGALGRVPADLARYNPPYDPYDPGGRHHARVVWPAALDAVRVEFTRLGWTDTTDQHAARHEHVVGCVLCGARDVHHGPTRDG